MEEASKRFGTIDILVNNAGVVLLAPAKDLTDERGTSTMAVNRGADDFPDRRPQDDRPALGKIISMASQAG